ncbi:MAG: terminase [Sphingomonas sp.]|uniref:terminase large subunit n=1 Tax=Sphingomonas sp. TaxID=28214 RepID=UPI000DBBE712|nr:terminase large subunit [Sphingomonas sp.]PZU77745.1 MAG: terminase [Sphingomonas sp.]
MGFVAEALERRFADPTWAPFACPDWADRLAAGRSLIPDDLRALLDWGEAERAVAIFNKLRLPDVPGQPLLADAAGEWQRDIVRVLFGTIDPDSRVRLLREIFALVPKKNAKTTGGAAIMVTALLMNQRPRAEFVLVGPTQEVADTAFQQAAGMVDADEFLRTRFHVAEHTKTITDRLTKARLKIKTFDMKVATGSKPAGILLDELHLMASMADAGRVIGQLRGGMIANPEAFMVVITTQSDKPPAGAFKSELDYARGVRDGRIVEDVALLPLLYEFTEAMQRDGTWRDPANWRMVLPNLGLSITLERLAAEYRAARDKGVEEERRWASQHLNVQIGLALHTDRWLGADYWEGAVDKSITLAAMLVRCEVITGGVDGGGLDDLMALGLVGRCKVTRDWLTWGRAWAHDSVWDRRKDIVGTLEDFVADGDLIRCTTPTQDLEEIAALLVAVKDAGLLPEKDGVGVDPYAIGALIEECLRQGLTDDDIFGIRQGSALSPAIWTTERKLSDGTMHPAAQAIMAWSVSNARVEQRGNAVLITKQTAGKAKIDLLIALLNAVMLMSRNPEAKPTSVYKSRGVRRI